ncbi:hypothetical protein B0H14DRAFT_2974526 [Mycena olivaceomarginata]|nr:hypothetical protein B0H14DRAFT_2974526 [Mycena olivaceomarginata]
MQRAHASPSTGCSQFSAQDSVLCWYCRKLYPAKILKIKDSASDCSPTQRYFVHYIGWAKSWDNWRKASQILVDNAHNRSISLVHRRKLVTPQTSLPPRFRIKYKKTHSKHTNTGRGRGSRSLNHPPNPEGETRVSFHDNDSVGSTLKPHLNRRLKRTVKNMCGTQSLGVMSPETATHFAVPHPPSPFISEPASSRLDVNQQNTSTVLEGLLRQMQELTREVAQVRNGIRNGIRKSHGVPIHPIQLFAPGFDSELVNETVN